MSYGLGVGVFLGLYGKVFALSLDLGDVEMPEINFPVESRHIVPQVKIDENDFLTTKDNYITLKLHLPKKSLFDNEVDYYALWINENDKKKESKAPFIFEDDVVALLEADQEAEIESKCQLEKGQSYLLKVYMDLLKTQVPIYDGKLVVEGEFMVEPSEISFGPEGGTQKVTIKKEGYPYYGATVSKPWDEWISVVVNSNGTADIVVKPNTTSEARQGVITFWGSTVKNPEDNEKKEFKVHVSQEPQAASNEPYVTPTELNYTAEGGTQNVKVHFGKYNRSGYSISNEGRNWVTVSNTGTETGFYIKVKANDTGKERTCIVNAHFTSEDNPTPDQIVTIPIAITQEANALEPGQISMQSISSCELNVTAMMKDRKKGRIINTDYQQVFLSPNISFTQNGTTVHVQATNNYTEGTYDVQNLIEFDIANFGGDFSSCTIENLQFRHIYSNTYVDYTQPGVYGKGDDIEIELQR